MYGEGVGNKPLSVHLTAGRIQLCILPGPVDAIQTCLDLLRWSCSFQLSSGNLTLSGSLYAWLSSFLLQSRPSRASDLRRTTCILERGLSSVSYTVSDPPTPSLLSSWLLCMNLTVANLYFIINILSNAIEIIMHLLYQHSIWQKLKF